MSAEDQLTPDAVCDGGDLDCGSGLLLIIREAMQPLPSGGLLEVRSREISVKEDLPANTAVRLPYPYNMTFPLPAPTAQPQATVPLPTMSLKLIPGVGGNNPPPALAQLISAPWQLKGDFSGGSGASVQYQASEDDPFYKLPVLKVLGAMFMSGDMTLALKDMKVAQDLLKQ
jgi:hypothetical protein